MVIILGYVKKIGRKSSKGSVPPQEKSDTESSRLTTVPGGEYRTRLEISTLAGPISRQQKMKTTRCNKKACPPIPPINMYI
jgi:hypothetical protein